MASQEADPTELPAACAGEAPGSLGQAAAADSSAYRPGGRSQSHPEVLQALGLESSLGMHSASTTVALVGIVFLSMNLFANEPLLKDCQSSRPPDLCIYMAASSNGLLSLMLILTLLELCIACSVVALWLKANCCHLRKAISSLSNPGESRMPPKESKEIQS